MSDEEKKQAAEKKISEHSVIRYLSILFAAAFFLLLITFAMERRQHEALQEQTQEQINSLQQSISATQSLKQLYEENDTLKEEVRDLKERLQDTQQELESQSQQLQTQTDRLTALDWFWLVEQAYDAEEFDLCRARLSSMTELELVELLPRQSLNPQVPSPYDRLMTIQAELAVLEKPTAP